MWTGLLYSLLIYICELYGALCHIVSRSNETINAKDEDYTRSHYLQCCNSSHACVSTYFAWQLLPFQKRSVHMFTKYLTFCFKICLFMLFSYLLNIFKVIVKDPGLMVLLRLFVGSLNKNRDEQKKLKLCSISMEKRDFNCIAFWTWHWAGGEKELGKYCITWHFWSCLIQEKSQTEPDFLFLDPSWNKHPDY